MEPLVIPVRDRRLLLAERMDLVGHGAAAAGLLTAAADALPAATTGGTLFAAVEIAAAAALILAVIREVRAKDDEQPARISWLNLIAAVVLLAE